MPDPISTITVTIISALIYDLAKKGIRNLSSGSPLKRAIQQSARDFGNIEDLANTLEDWIAKEEVIAQLQNFEKGEKDVPTDELARTLVEKAGFYCGEESTDVAREILSKFFENLNEQYLKSEDGHVYQTSQIERATRQIIEKIDAHNEEHKQMALTFKQMGGASRVPSTVLSEVKPESITERLLSKIDSLLKEGKTKTAKELSLKALSDLQKQTPDPGRVSLQDLHTSGRLRMGARRQESSGRVLRKCVRSSVT